MFILGVIATKVATKNVSTCFFRVEQSNQNRGWGIRATMVALIAQSRFWVLCLLLKRTYKYVSGCNHKAVAPEKNPHKI